MRAYTRHSWGDIFAAVDRATREDTAIQPHITLDSHQRLEALVERLRRFVEAGEAEHGRKANAPHRT